MRNTGVDCNASNITFKLALSPRFLSLVRTAISRRLIALKATGSVRRTVPSKTLVCSRESFLASNNHRTTTWV